MRFVDSGRKDLSCKFGSIISFVRKNCKLELLVTALSVLCMNISCRFPLVAKVIADYFTETRCSGIAGFASITIGIYVTVWSIFATSASKINAELLKNKIEGQLFFLIGIDLAEAFLATILCAFIPREIPHYTGIVACFTALTALSFVKFIMLTMKITKLNIKYIAQEIDEQNAKCTEVQVKLDEIYQETINKGK